MLGIATVKGQFKELEGTVEVGPRVRRQGHTAPSSQPRMPSTRASLQRRKRAPALWAVLLFEADYLPVIHFSLDLAHPSDRRGTSLEDRRTTLKNPTAF